MELHTLGVDGGYTQDDVINVAKAFTGWSIRQPRRDPEFFFEERLHDTSVKTVLGHQIHEGGMKDGEEVLDILARDPHTAHHISFELAQRFVSDNPPAALVDRMAQTFLKSDGDIREVLHTMIYSPEFWSKEAYRAKIKTPFELVASATRAVGAEVDSPAPARAMDEPHRPAALPVRASDRLLRQSRCVGEYRRTAQPHEFFAGAHVESSPRRAGGYRFSVWQRHGRQSARHARPRDSSLAGRPGVAGNSRHAGKAAGRSADFAGQLSTTRSSR